MSDVEAQAELEVDGRAIALRRGETVLDACLRAGVPVGHSCRAGLCRACLVRAVDGNPPREAQQGLRAEQIEAGWFLACRARPTQALKLRLDGAAGQRARARLVQREWLAPEIVRLGLELEQPFEHRGGQFLGLARADGCQRSYSVASVPELDPWIELHVRVLPAGELSRWLAHEAALGVELELHGPTGDCVYPRGSRDEGLLLVGVGTGLAPLWAVLREALHSGHRGPLALVHGARVARGLYLGPELEALAAQVPNLRLTRCVLEGEAPAGVARGSVLEAVGDLGELDAWRVFLCGAPEFVEQARRRCFLAGAGLERIRADAFAAAPAKPKS